MAAYEEKQQFQGLWILIPMFIFSIPTFFFIDRAEGLIGLLIVAGVLGLGTLVLFSLRQTVRIDKIGVHYKQSPIHRTYRTQKWQDIQHWQINKISALGDFGGWGYRVTSKKIAYIIDGKYGLELTTDAKKLIVLSIKDKEKAEEAMEKLGQFV